MLQQRHTCMCLALCNIREFNRIDAGSVGLCTGGGKTDSEEQYGGKNEPYCQHDTVIIVTVVA